MSATVVVKRPPVPVPPPKNINFATWEDAERVANNLASSGVVPSGEITVYEGTNQDVGGGVQTDSGLPLLIDFSIEMPFKNELGIMVNVMVPFHEVAGELVDRLDSYPNGTWLPSIVAGSTQATVAGDMERR